MKRQHLVYLIKQTIFTAGLIGSLVTVNTAWADAGAQIAPATSPNYLSSAPIPFQPGTPRQQTTQPTTSQPFNLTSSMFGLTGPLSIGAQYSENYGALLQGQWTQLFSAHQGGSLGFQLGSLQRRLSGTWGVALNDQNWVKLTTESLSQKMNFNFDSGDTKQWVYQNATGATYQYNLTNGFFKDINLNSLYSQAISKSLDARTYLNNDILYLNNRRIAGARDIGNSVGIDTTPFDTTLLGLQANYDDLVYKMRYSRDDQSHGLGETITLQQLITQHVKLNLLASDREIYKNYQAEISWLLNTKPGSQLEFELAGTRILGEQGSQSDTQFNLNLVYAFGGSENGHPATYSFTSNKQADNESALDSSSLQSWIGQPAVQMQSVLAKIDQETIVLNNPTQSSLTAPTAGNDIDTITVHPNQQNIAIAIPTQDMQSHLPTSNASTQINYTVNNLPAQLTYQNGVIKNATINGSISTFSNADVGKTFLIPVFANTTNDNDPQPIETVTLKVAPNDLPYIDPGYIRPTDAQLTFYANEPITPVHFQDVDQDLAHPNIMFFDTDFPDQKYPMTLSVTGVETSGLQINYGLNKQSTATAFGPYYSRLYPNTVPYFIISGTPTRAGDYPITVSAKNEYGPSSNQLQLTLHVITDSPTINIPDQSFQYNQPVHQDITAYITAGHSAAAVLQSVQADLSQYGLAIHLDPTTHHVTIDGTPNASTFTQQSISITVSNQASTIQGQFNLNIAGPPIKKSDLPNTSIYQNNSITIENLSSYFQNPTQSGSLKLALSDKIPTDVVQAVFNETTDSLTITGLKATTQPLTFDLISATNTAFPSLPAIAQITVTVLSNTPVITPSPSYTPLIGKVGDSIDVVIAKASTPTGSIASVQSTDVVLADHGLSLQLGSDNSTIHLVGTLKNPTASPQPFRFIVNNDLGQTATSTRNIFDIAGPAPTIIKFDQLQSPIGYIGQKIQNLQIAETSTPIASITAVDEHGAPIDLHLHNLQFDLSPDGTVIYLNTINNSGLQTATTAPKRFSIEVADRFGQSVTSDVYLLEIAKPLPTIFPVSIIDHLNQPIDTTIAIIGSSTSPLNQSIRLNDYTAEESKNGIPTSIEGLSAQVIYDPNSGKQATIRLFGTPKARANQTTVLIKDVETTDPGAEALAPTKSGAFSVI